MSPLRASKSPVPSEPLPGALTTRNGLLVTLIARDLSASEHDLVTALTPFISPAKTDLSSLSYWLPTLPMPLSDSQG